MSKSTGSKRDDGPLSFLGGACLATIVATILWFTGACDNPSSWTASDMRGEYQRRLTEINEKIAEANRRDAEPWEIIRLGAERAELMAITEPYE